MVWILRVLLFLQGSVHDELILNCDGVGGWIEVEARRIIGVALQILLGSLVHSILVSEGS